MTDETADEGTAEITDTLPEILTAREATAYLRVTLAMVYRLAARGEIPAEDGPDVALVQAIARRVAERSGEGQHVLREVACGWR